MSSVIYNPFINGSDVTDPAVDPLDTILRIIISELDPERILLFGSRSRRDNREDSNYDLLIIKDGGSRSMLRKVYDSLGGIGASIDMILVDGKKLEENIDDPYMIYGTAIREGTLLYAKA